MKQDTPVGPLAYEGGLWTGRFTNEALGADVELLVNGDDAGPQNSEVAALQQFLASFQENVLAMRKKLTFSFSYYPIRIAITPQGSLGVQFQSFLPFVGRKMVHDDGRVY